MIDNIKQDIIRDFTNKYISPHKANIRLRMKRELPINLIKEIIEFWEENRWRYKKELDNDKKEE